MHNTGYLVETKEAGAPMHRLLSLRAEWVLKKPFSGMEFLS